MTTSPLLSICIPTFNRSKALRATLESIVSQPAFLETDEVEVVVSDNASTDDTPLVVAEFVNRFPGKIVCWRQPRNVWTANFYQAMSLGRGQFLKLHNDTLIVREGALKTVLDSIRGLLPMRPLIFMTNGNRGAEGEKPFESCFNLDEFVEKVSFFATWIGGFGLWREDLELARAFQNDTSHLVQTELLYKQLAEGRPAVVFFGGYFLSKQDFRGSYNWAEVFGKNYLGLLKQYLASGKLSAATYEKVKKEVLMRHILPTYFGPDNAYAKTNFFENLADYRDDDYFHEAIERYLPFLWRFNNPGSRIEVRAASHPSLLARVRVGRMSRGGFKLLGKRNGAARLDIGNLVTLGDEVSFVLDEAQTREDCFSNYASGAKEDDGANTSIVVGDDAWIGSGALISSGVTIGQGAIVAAGSVVTEDVPPYGKVAGNPARMLGYRFDAEVIGKLCAFDFSGLTDAAMNTLGEVLRASVNPDNVDALLFSLATGEAPPPALPAQTAQRVPAVLVLDDAGDPHRVAHSLSALAAGEHRALPVIILTTQPGEMPAWTDTCRYIQADSGEYASVAEQLRALPDFEWVSIVKAGL